jgi:cyclic beta-1,2-glucan synthetase
MAAIDLVLDRRIGSHGLPLIGTGDWNDGLDEIGSQGRGESVWLGFFLCYILSRMTPIIEKKDGPRRLAHYTGKMRELNDSIEATWRGDRYLRAIHDDGSEIGVAKSGVWKLTLTRLGCHVGHQSERADRF